MKKLIFSTKWLFGADSTFGKWNQYFTRTSISNTVIWIHRWMALQFTYFCNAHYIKKLLNSYLWASSKPFFCIISDLYLSPLWKPLFLRRSGNSGKFRSTKTTIYKDKKVNIFHKMTFRSGLKIIKINNYGMVQIRVTPGNTLKYRHLS